MSPSCHQIVASSFDRHEIGEGNVGAFGTPISSSCSTTKTRYPLSNGSNLGPLYIIQTSNDVLGYH